MISTNQVCPQQILTNMAQYADWLGEGTIEKKCNTSPASSLRLRRYMCTDSVSEYLVPSLDFIFLENF